MTPEEERHYQKVKERLSHNLGISHDEVEKLVLSDEDIGIKHYDQRPLIEPIGKTKDKWYKQGQRDLIKEGWKRLIDKDGQQDS